MVNPDVDFDRPDNIFARIVEDIVYSGSLGWWMDTYEAVLHDKLLESVGGPTISNVNEVVSGVTHGDVGKTVVRQIPVVRQLKSYKPKKKQPGF